MTITNGTVPPGRICQLCRRRPGYDGSDYAVDVEAALQICAGCPILARCARQADDHYDPYRCGVLAGRRWYCGKVENPEAVPA